MRDLDLLGQMEAENERLERKVDYWRDKAKESAAEIEHLRALLTRVLVAEGRCPTRLLIDISRTLENMP
jgi:hypothetical protein